MDMNNNSNASFPLQFGKLIVAFNTVVILVSISIHIIKYFNLIFWSLNFFQLIGAGLSGVGGFIFIHFKIYDYFQGYF